MSSLPFIGFVPRKARSLVVPAAGALALGLSGLWMLEAARVAHDEIAKAPTAAPTSVAANPFGAVAVGFGHRARVAQAAAPGVAPEKPPVIEAAKLQLAEAAPKRVALTPPEVAIEASVAPMPPRRDPGPTKPQDVAQLPAAAESASAEIAPLPPRRDVALLTPPEALPAPILEAGVAPLPPRRDSSLPAQQAAAPVESPVAETAAPVPPARPDELSAPPPRVAAPALPPASTRRTAAQERQTTVASQAPADGPSFLERIFGAPETAAPQPAGRRRGSGRALAYAATPDTGLFGGARSAAEAAPSPGRYDRFTAVYDISARTVYLPNGTRLEAHSGLREHLDDPRFVHVRMRGATPPNLYELTPREQLFHGVEALRLNPIGGGTYGRAGLLAHTYMLGPNGDSNGCVSFRDYDAFLRAYKNGEVKRLAVVAHM
jgi:hypothetical protein